MRATLGRFLLGDWAVDPDSSSLSRGEERRQIEPRAMQVLEALSRRPGEVLSAEQLLAECWPETPAGDNPVHKTVAQLRRVLDDSASAPRYIETIRKRGYRVLAPVRSADGAAPLAREGGWRGGSPFRGLRSFDAAHAEVFFGREQALQQLLQTVRCQWQQRRAFTLLLGPSGSGKTSLVLAGLAPALQALSTTSLDLGDLGAHLPLAALGAALLDWDSGGAEARPVFPGASAEALAHSLMLTPAAVLAEIAAARAGRTGDGVPLLLFIDRLEALFVAPHVDAFARKLFLDALQALADSGDVIVVAACRNDFYPRLSEHALLMRDKSLGGHFDLVPPTRAEIALMIRLPARAAGLSFGIDPATRTRLDDQLCDDAAASPDALPLLQYTLEELYRRRGPHGELRFEAYRELGGLEGAIGRRAESEIAALLPIQQAALPQVLALLVMLPGEGQGTTGRRALWDELAGPAERELVQALVDARLLVSDLGAGEQAGFRVAHEAILRRWPRVTEWIATHQQALQLRSRLRQQVERWQAEGRAAEYLLPKGKQLVEVVELLEHGVFSFSAAERAYVRTSQARAARGGRLRVAAIGALALLTVLSAGLAWRAQRAEDLARRRSAQADDLLGYMLGDFADKLRPIGRLGLLDSVGSKALEHLAAGGDETDAGARLQRAKALTVIGEVRVSKRELDAAVEPLEAARRLLEPPLPGAGLTAAWRKAQGTADFWLGHVHYTQRQLAAARLAFEAYRVHAAQWLAAAPGEAEPLIELSYAQNSLGSVLLDSGDLTGAAEQFRASIELKRQAQRGRPKDLTLQMDLADSLSWRGTVFFFGGEFAQARELFAEGVALIEAARSQAPADLDWAYREAAMRVWLAEALRDMGQAEAAVRQLQVAGGQLRSLLQQEPGNQRWSFELIRMEVAQADLARAAGRGGSPQQLISRLDALDRATNANGALRRLPVRAQALWLRAHELRAGKQAEQAHGLLTQLLNALNGALLKRPEDLKLRAAVARTLLELSRNHQIRQESGAARAQCQAVVDQIDDLRPLLRVHFHITKAWVEAYSCLDRGGDVELERAWLAQKTELKPPP
ncbi:MAG TPA: winged helix-turn-helix domain-containing protein [Roseateles sp.]|nr:winged helix-turn-helix domain-containing protein [Roseateles sp.]